jgi:hypothetical protein
MDTQGLLDRVNEVIAFGENVPRSESARAVDGAAWAQFRSMGLVTIVPARALGSAPVTRVLDQLTAGRGLARPQTPIGTRRLGGL